MSTRNEILQIAYETFAEKGYRGTSLDYIAKKIGVTRPALYYHFSSKEDLFMAVYAQIDPLVSARPDAVLTTTDKNSYLVQFNDLMQAIIGNLRSDPLRARFVAAVESAAYQSPEILEEVHKQDTAIRKIFSDVLQHGNKLGILHKKLDVETATQYLNVIFNGASELLLRGSTFSWSAVGPLVCTSLFTQ